MEERELPLVKENKNERHLDERGWKRQTTKLIAYNFGVMVRRLVSVKYI